MKWYLCYLQLGRADELSVAVSMQKVTGFDFFPGLSESEEKALESKIELNKWGL
jgi:hypothetical protein